MDTILLVSKILGIYLVLSGIFLITRGKTVSHLLRDFFDHPAVMYLTGVILVFLSSLYLLQYNSWDSTPNSVVTLFVWLVMLKGIIYIFAPRMLSGFVIKNNRKMFVVYGVVAIFVGIYLFYLP